MRLLSSEYKDIIAMLQSHGIQKGEFAFRKKRGWLFIELQARQKPFSFHRKKSVEIVGNQFQDRVVYRVSIDAEIKEYGDWDGVKDAFAGWLNTG